MHLQWGTVHVFNLDHAPFPKAPHPIPVGIPFPVLKYAFEYYKNDLSQFKTISLCRDTAQQQTM